MGFPFDVPEDLTALSAEDFAAFLAKVREHAATIAGDASASAADIRATRELFTSVTAEETRRTEELAQAEAERAALAADLAEPQTDPEPEPQTDPEPTPAPDADPKAVTASKTPKTPVKTVDQPPAVENEKFAVLVASSDAPAMQVGTELTFAGAGALLEKRLASYPKNAAKLPSNRAVKRRLGGHRTLVDGRTMLRHGVAEFQRQFPEALRITDSNKAWDVIEYAMSEARLTGGNLKAAMEASLKGGKALTAAVGWCAPSETIYELCALETMDGILDVPEIQASRGGFNIPENGGPDFSVIYDSIGDDGDVILTEYDVENGVDKVCIEIPCPDFVEVRLDVAYICLTGSLLQRRGYPEAVTRFSQGTMVALAHKVNESVIARMVAGSGAPIVISADASGDDAVSSLLSAVELAIEDMKYRNRLGRNQTLEVVLPAWVIAPMRAALARRTGVAEYDVSDAQILAAFTTRGAVPHFVYDWQDAFSGQVGAPGGATPITAFPATVSFLVYPAGTWVKPVQDVINLDTVYDNAMLTQNQYTALFAEEGFNMMKMCVESRLYTVPVDPSGVVGCCP